MSSLRQWAVVSGGDGSEQGGPQVPRAASRTNGLLALPPPPGSAGEGPWSPPAALGQAGTGAEPSPCCAALGGGLTGCCLPGGPHRQTAWCQGSQQGGA